MTFSEMGAARDALIMGGARGIGAGIARVMAGQGARVALLDRDGPEEEKTIVHGAPLGIAGYG